MRRLPALLLAALAVLVAVVLVGSLVDAPRPTRPAALSVPVVGSSVVCPSLEDAPDTSTRTGVAVAVAPVPPGSRTADGGPSGGAAPDPAAPAGRVTAGPLTGTAQPLPLGVPGTVVAGVGSGVDDALVVGATGALAAGLDVQQRSRTGSGDSPGDAAARCEAPRTESWFAGGATAGGEQATLVLANADDTSAVVDVQVWAADGDVDDRAGRGLVVPARGRLTVPVDTLAPGRSGLALHVLASRGRVAAGLLSRLTAPGAGGTDWVPRSPAPATRVVVATLPAGPGARSVRVTNPGEDDTVVALQLGTADGSFVPTGLEAVPVPAGSTVTTDLTGALAATPATVTVTSRIGGVLAVGVAAGGGDVAYAGAGGPLAGPALVTEPLPDAGVTTTLLLTAPAADASVVLTPLAAAGATGPAAAGRTVPVPAGTTVQVPLADLGSPPGLQVRPASGSGPVVAARSTAGALPGGGTATTLLTLEPVQQRVQRPAVTGDPGAALPAG